ncbi:Hypothetical predicted protein [Mytilus galloprovincialis]|uniref:Uncharacterized protein n=1 Tax=Mytilus galloprovincialis TaxID=29158 RepID=A0A8B6DVT7_MYTGA|nr:Hypothetical predicted protein [Mytilus galloprovincialis]
MEQDSEPVPVRTLPFTPGASQLRLSRPSRVSHTVTRPAEIPTSPVACTTSRQETLPAGIRSDPFSRTRLDLMESRGLSQDPAQDPPRPPRQLLEDDSVSLAPRSQEGNFLEDQDGISDVDSVVSTEGDAFAPKEPCFRQPELP